MIESNQSVPHATAILSPNGELTTQNDRVMPVYSLTKTIIAQIVAQLEIPSDRSVDQYFSPELLPHRGLTLNQLLTHTSGLLDYGLLPAYTTAIQNQQTWEDEDFIQHTLRQPLLFKPGTAFAYANPGYWLLKRLIELETGLSFAATVQQFICQPLELNNTKVVQGQFAEDLPHYPAGWVWHGLVLSTAADMVRFMTQVPGPKDEEMVDIGRPHPPWKQPHYAYGLMVEPGVMYGHNGGGPRYTASCFKFFESQTTYCVIANSDEDELAMKSLLEMV